MDRLFRPIPRDDRPEIRNSVPFNSVEILRDTARRRAENCEGLVYISERTGALQGGRADIPDEGTYRQEVCQDTPRGSLLVTVDWHLHG